MQISVITLFPEMFSGPFSSSIIKRAQESGAVTIDFINLRDFSNDRYRTVDDHPYGGGVGMVLRVDVLDRAIQHTKSRFPTLTSRTILLDPQGTTYNQKKARTLTTLAHLILICGHYEGIDERVRNLVDEELSIGDFIVTGGEIPAMVVIDSVARLLPGVLRNQEASQNESFESGTLEYPQYTRPEVYKGISVPDILRSGNHAKIATWRKEQSLRRTKKLRPDLMRKKSHG